MTNTMYTTQAAVLKAMAHPVRLQILDLLRGGEQCVCHLEAVINRRQAYISQQLMILREAGLINSRREARSQGDGRQIYYWITDDTTRAVLDALLGTEVIVEEPVDGCGCPSCAIIVLE